VIHRIERTNCRQEEVDKAYEIIVGVAPVMTDAALPWRAAMVSGIRRHNRGELALGSGSLVPVSDTLDLVLWAGI
jgi:hypothetical protein